MKFLLIWSIIIFLLILLYLLSKFYIRHYFDHTKGRFDSSKSNYISYIAIFALLSGFIGLNPKTINFLIVISIETLNNKFQLNLAAYQYDVTIIDLIFYLVFSLAIIIIIYFSFRHRFIQWQIILNQEKDRFRESQTINFPEQENKENPLFHERIKEIFELKFIKYNLTLKETVISDENKILYGSYSDDFNIIYEIIYCDNTSKEITKSKINEVLNHLEINIFNKLTNKQSNSIAHYYYISEKIDISPTIANSKIKIYNEDKFLNSVIDFTRYLNKLQQNFEKEKLFSVNINEDKKRTLCETYIEPAFLINNEKHTKKTKLTQYVLDWIKDQSLQKHLVLLGDYGMGKTSFLKFISSKLAEDYLKEGECIRFPILISLTNCSPIHGGIHKTIKSFVAENLGVDYNLFKRLVDKGKILFLLDAFDEMGFLGTKEQRFKQFNEIWQLATKNNKILITGRPSYFPTEFELEHILAIPREGHEIVQTLPYAEKIVLSKLDNKRMQSYIEKYYPEKAEIYFKWILQNQGLHELCKRPSMMHIIREMLEELYESNYNSGLSTADIMHKYIEYWINRQKSKRIESAFQGNEMSKNHFIQSFFTDLASDYYLNGYLQANAENITNRITAKIQALNIPGFERKENLEGFQQELLTGYFIEREDDDYKFVHKSFFDYFVARKIIQLLEKRQFKHPLMYKQWNLEIVDFIYETIPSRYKTCTKIPALLGFSNSRLVAWIKLYYLKINILLKRALTYSFDLIFIIYGIIILILTTTELLDVKTDNNLNFNNLFGFLNIRFGYFLILILLFLASLIFLRYKLRRIKEFTEKALMLSISKNEPNSQRLIPSLFGIGMLTIKIKNIKISKFTPLLFRTFDESIIENCKFENCKFEFTSFYDCRLKNIDLSNSNFLVLRFINCYLENVDFSNLILTRSKTHIGIFLIRRLLSLFNIPVFKRNSHILSFINTSTYHIDDKTINSLRNFIHQNKIKIDTEIIADNWLLEKLKCTN